MRAWRKIFESGVYKQHDWVVKVDPDAVFFPERLRQHLKPQGDGAWSRKYFRNCPQFRSMQGPLEVLSRGAVDAFAAGNGQCLSWIDLGHIGEDGFLQKCLDSLGIQQVRDWTLLTDLYCGQQPRPCANRWTVAFHPFKPKKDYFMCMNESGYAIPDPLP